MNVKAIKPLVYGGNRYNPGDEFIIHDRPHIRVLQALGRIAIFEAKTPKPKTVKSRKRTI